MPSIPKPPSPVTVMEVTSNSKTGPISATFAGQQTCPTTCPLLNRGCYAELGPMRFVTNRLNAMNADPLESARQEAQGIGDLTGRRPLRVHVVGDCATNETANIISTAMLAHTRKHKQPAWTYTHASDQVDVESWNGATVLASCESIEGVKRAKAKGYFTALIVDSHASAKTYVEAGETITPCPQQTTRDVTCESCRLCTRVAFLKDHTVAFAAHGARQKTVRNLLKDIEA